MSSSVSCGIVGLPNVGKSTLFNALTKGNALAANYPFATIDPNVGVVAVPDSRLSDLANIYNSRTVIPASISFVDIAGLVAGASTGEGMGNRFLSHVRATDVLIMLVRAFENPNVTHVNNAVNPRADIDIITTELVLADLQTLQKSVPKLEKEVKANQKLALQLDTYRAALTILDDGQPLFHHSELSKEHLSQLGLLTIKPLIYVFNVDEQTLQDDATKAKLAQIVAPATCLFICAQLEAELSTLDVHDASELLASYGQSEPGLSAIIATAYTALRLQSYLTAGEKEVRAWTIPIGATAPEAAGVIHSDFERGFIAAEVVSFQDLMAAGSLAAARSAGKVRTEGKTYIMQPDDVVEFRFNV